MNLYRVAMTDHRGQSRLTYAGEAATDVLAVLRSAHGVGMFPTPTGWNVVTVDSTDGDLAALSLVHDDGRAVTYLIAPALTVTGEKITWPEHDYTPPCEVIAAERMLDGLDPRECGECGQSEADCQGSRVAP